MHAPHRNPRTRLATSLLCTLLLAACQSVDPAFLTPQGRLVRDVDPIPFRVAVAPLTVDAGVEMQARDAAGMGLVFDAAGLQARLIAELRGFRAATEVFGVAAPALEAAKNARADLLLRPRVTAVRIAHQGASTSQVLSTFLWMTTWVGGMFVTDSTYDARLEVEWDIVNPFDNRNIDSFVTSSEHVDLTWWRRNGFFSLPLLQTLVLPPVLTTDHATTTSRSLSEIAAARVAARLAGHLKSDFGREARDVVGELRIDAPDNGATVPTDARLRGRIVAREPITAVNIYVNEQPMLVLKEGDILPAIEQSRGSTFQLPLDHVLALRQGKNEVAIEFAVRGNYTSRTLIIHRASAQHTGEVSQ